MTYEIRLRNYLQDVKDHIRLAIGKDEAIELTFEPVNVGKSFEAHLLRARFLYYGPPDPHIPKAGAIVEIGLCVNPEDFVPAKDVADELLGFLKSGKLGLVFGTLISTWTPTDGMFAGKPSPVP